MRSTTSTNKAMDAVAEFCKNPFWRGYYENAPEGAKALIRHQFIMSACLDGNVVAQSVRKRRIRLLAADWKYLYEFARDNHFIGQAVGCYRKQYEMSVAAKRVGCS